MIPEDDAVRRALMRDLPASQAASVLHSLRPAMRRQRAQRRAAIATAAAIALMGGGAGALALGASLQNQASVSDQSATTQILGTLEPVSTDSVAIDTTAPPADAPEVPAIVLTESTAVATTPPPVVETPPVTLSPAPPQPAPVLPPATTTAAPVAAVPVPPTPVAPTPTPTVPSTTTAANRLERVESACGVLIVAVAGNTIGVSELLPQSGFTANVSDDGPTSIEVTFVSSSRKCELHVELKSGTLAVEVQNNS